MSDANGELCLTFFFFLSRLSELCQTVASPAAMCIVEKVVNGQCLGVIVQELCESRGGRPGLSVLTSLLASVDVKLY